MGARHNLPSINIIDDVGRMENVPEPFKGKLYI